MTRREWMGIAAAFGAAAAQGQVQRMYLSLNGSLTGSMPWPDFARLAARVGFAGVDVNLPAARKDGFAATRALFEETRLIASNAQFSVNFTGDDATFQRGMDGLEEAAKFAAAIDCPRFLTILPPASKTPKEELRKILKGRLTAVSAVLAKQNARLGLEFLGPLHFRTAQPFEFIWRMDEALDFAQECGPNIGLLLDVWHWYHAGATTGDIQRAGRDRIVHVHLSDCPKLPPEQVRDNQRVLPGEGVIPLVEFFQALKRIGYTGGVSPEPLGRMKDMSPEAGARLGLDTALKVMREAGVA